MEKRKLGNTGFSVSAIAYGGIVSAARYGSCASYDGAQKDSDRYVSWAIEQGVNYFDVAPTYGDAQQRLGDSLRPYRKDVYLACKTSQRKYDKAKEELCESLRLLHTDYLDVYQLHSLSSPQELETAFGPGGVIELLREIREKGIARKVGITSHDEKTALRALELFDFDTLLFPFNWHMHMAHRMGEQLLKKAKEKKIGVLCMKSMIERAWDETADVLAKQKFPKSWCKPIDPDTDAPLLLAALKYAAGLGVDCIIPPGNFTHFSFAASHGDQIFGEPLSDEEKKLLDSRLELVRDRPFFTVA